MTMMATERMKNPKRSQTLHKEIITETFPKIPNVNSTGQYVEFNETSTTLIQIKGWNFNNRVERS